MVMFLPMVMSGERGVLELILPKELHKDLKQVLEILPVTTPDDISIQVSVDYIEYRLDDYVVRFPYRMYLDEPEETVIQSLSDNQKLILACLYTRSHNGYIRQKYVEQILNMDFPKWCIPYIVKLWDIAGLLKEAELWKRCFRRY